MEIKVGQRWIYKIDPMQYIIITSTIYKKCRWNNGVSVEYDDSPVKANFYPGDEPKVDEVMKKYGH